MFSLSSKNHIDHPFHRIPAAARPNTNISFAIYDDSEDVLNDSPSPFVIEAWSDFIADYSGELGITLVKFLKYGALSGYEGGKRVLYSKNARVALQNKDYMSKRILDDFVAKRTQQVTPSAPFISSPLGLAAKHDGGLRKTTNLSYGDKKGFNGNISDECAYLTYLKVARVKEMFLTAGRRCIIFKRDMKDAFRNITLSKRMRWLFGFE